MMTLIDTFGADFDTYSVDVNLYTKGSTRHKVQSTVIRDDLDQVSTDVVTVVFNSRKAALDYIGAILVGKIVPKIGE